MVFQFNWIWTSNKGGANAAASPFILPAGETQTSVNQKHGKQHVKDFLEEHCDQLGYHRSCSLARPNLKPQSAVTAVVTEAFSVNPFWAHMNEWHLSTIGCKIMAAVSAEICPCGCRFRLNVKLLFPAKSAWSVQSPAIVLMFVLKMFSLSEES